MADLALASTGVVHLVETVQQLTLIAAAAITGGMACRIDTAGKFVGADASAAGTADVYGIALRTVAAGEAVTCVRRGVLDGFVLDALAYGAKIYLSDTGTNVGVLADAAGTSSQICGKVIPAWGQSTGGGADKLFLVECTG